MTAIKFTCPHCTQKIEAGEEWGGMSVNCPHCGTQIIVPKNNIRAVEQVITPKQKEATKAQKIFGVGCGCLIIIAIIIGVLTIVGASVKSNEILLTFNNSSFETRQASLVKMYESMDNKQLYEFTALLIFIEMAGEEGKKLFEISDGRTVEEILSALKTADAMKITTNLGIELRKKNPNPSELRKKMINGLKTAKEPHIFG